MPDTIRWVLAGLGAYRLTWSLMFDDGLLGILFIIRKMTGAYARDELGNFRNEFWHCPYCVGLLSAAIMAALAMLHIDVIIVWLGLAGVVSAFVRWRPWRNYEKSD